MLNKLWGRIIIIIDRPLKNVGSFDWNSLNVGIIQFYVDPDIVVLNRIWNIIILLEKSL